MIRRASFCLLSALLTVSAFACAPSVPAVGPTIGKAPAPRPARPQPTDQCKTDADCRGDLVCRERIMALCDVCLGGPMVKLCVPPPAGAKPPPGLIPKPAPTPGADCPKHISCMPPWGPGETCPPAGLMKRCPDVQISY